MQKFLKIIRVHKVTDSLKVGTFLRHSVEFNSDVASLHLSACVSVCMYVCLCVCLGQMTASDTLTWLKTHGTAVDNTSLVTSMLSRGQTVVLTGT